ncbi:MAG: AraC family transcriptional regulator ligand-binding domain-containing protein [Gemmatimonadota bacterium]
MPAGRTPGAVAVCLLWAFRETSLQAAGLERVLAEAGIDPSSLVDPRTRIPVSVSNRLLELQLAALGDPAFGLRTGTRCAPGAFGMVEQLARSAPTLRASIECYMRYDALIQEGAETELIEQGDRALIVYRTNEPLPHAVVDFVLSYTVAMMRRHVRGGIHVEELWISMPAPERATRIERDRPPPRIRPPERLLRGLRVLDRALPDGVSGEPDESLTTRRALRECRSGRVSARGG